MTSTWVKDILYATWESQMTKGRHNYINTTAHHMAKRQYCSISWSAGTLVQVQYHSTYVHNFFFSFLKKWQWWIKIKKILIKLVVENYFQSTFKDGLYLILKVFSFSSSKILVKNNLVTLRWLTEVCKWLLITLIFELAIFPVNGEIPVCSPMLELACVTYWL